MATVSDDSVAETYCFTINTDSLSLSIDGFVNGVPFRMLLDTGSANSLMSKGSFDKISSTFQVCSKPLLRLANGSAMIPVGRSVVFISYDNINTEHEIFIYDCLPFDVLLGLDFCSKTRLNIDFNKINFENKNTLKDLPFYMHVFESENNFDNKIKVLNDTRLKGKSGQMVEVFSNTIIPETFIFTPNLLNDNLMIEECLCSKINDKTLLFLTNPNIFEIFLRKGTVIGKWHNCKEIERNDRLPDGSADDQRSVDEIEFNIDENLPVDKKNDLKHFLRNYLKIFARNTKELTCTNITKHKIEVTDPKPVQSPPYRAAPKERTAMETQVHEMLEAGIIRESNSPYSSPVVMVKKPNGKLRFCVDYRKLNAITKKDAYPLPRIEDLMQAFGGSKLFSTLDMASGYWQIPVDEKDIEKTAFITPFGLYEFTVMPFGLSTAPETYQRMIDRLIAGLKFRICQAYLDDIIIYSKTFEDHIDRLETVFDCIIQANLKLQPEKCYFLKTHIRYLGWIVSADGNRPDPDKVKAIAKFKRPVNKKEIKRFLGMAGYYRDSIKNFSKIAEPILRLLRKNVEYVWTDNEEAAFIQLKHTLMTAPVLVHFNQEHEVRLHTDACYEGLGYVLVHVINGFEHPFRYGSRSLNICETNYGVTELECLAVVWSINKNRHFLLGKPFEVVSDHHSLCWMMRAKNPSGRLCRWTLSLQEYEFKVIYKSGKKHLDADALSRSPLKETSDGKENGFPMLNNEMIDLIKLQDNDIWCKSIKEKIQKEKSKDKTFRVGGKIYEYVEGVLYRMVDDGHEKLLQLLVPKELRKEILESLHDDRISGHLGITKTYAKLRIRYHWPKMFRSVCRYINRCLDCQTKKPQIGRPYGYGQLMEVPSIPFSTMGCDLLGKFPKSHNNKKYVIV